MEIPSIHPEQDHHSILLQPSSCVSKLENLALWFAKRQNKKVPDSINAATVLFAADHSVTNGMDYHKAVSTRERICNAAASDSVISELCRQAGSRLHIVDVGVRGCLADIDAVEHAKVRSSGTADITVESAMSQAEYWEIVGIGEEMANRTIAAGANLLIAGSIGAGDHISIAAIISELVGLSPEAALTSDPDTSPETRAREIMAIEKARARAIGTPSHDVLRELGGLEMAAMAGFYRGAALKGVPVLLDGLASATAALAAIAWDVRIAGWMLASHASDDAGHRDVLEEMGLDPLIELKHSLDEGKVATLMVPVLQAAISLQRGLARIEAQT
ncbi:MAG: nicotinate-nucleotide--dimethylbenzimidazole phosphoribosyltransferase [Mariprofundus sp.]|nr:nicotinate-nucleotide--dimethylbenzimidazole phosphoribosyltransferase [Mariprofundus sp.]